MAEVLSQSSATSVDSAVEAGFDSTADPIETLKTAAQTLEAAYWNDKDIAAVKRIAKLAIGWGLDKAKIGGDPDRAVAILGLVKAIAYNLGSFLWQGWDEPGIALGDPEREAGEEAAALNLRLAVELRRDPLPTSRAYWWTGAYRLAARDFGSARAEFVRAAELAEGVNAVADGALNRAYDSLTAMLEDETSASRKDYECAMKDLALVADGADLVAQVRIAEKVFTR